VTAHAAARALPRRQRKHNLLLASQLARGQVVGAFDDLAGRADAVAYRVLQVRAWLSSPLAWMVGGVAVTLAMRVTLRRGGRTLRLLRWGWLAWRVAAPALASYRARGRPERRAA